MPSRKLRTTADIAAWRLCMGCGACVYACPNEAISLIDIVDAGIRPRVDENKCQQCHDCVKICPGIELEHEAFDENAIDELKESWGPILEIWEGYANDTEIRYKGSSGGITTALALFCVENEGMAGVLHTGTNPKNPLQNVPVLSKSKEELLACAGSRYSPAAPCEKLNWIEEADSPCVFVGKPCDVVALRKSQALNTRLKDKVGLVISIFCAGTPSTIGTLSVLNTLGVTQEDVEEIRYRGCGWPGKTAIRIKSNGDKREMDYKNSWGSILSKHVPLRCRLCPDGTGELADISCGDAWHRKIKQGEPGCSLVLVRTAYGQEVLRKAIEAGYVELERMRPAVLPASQQSLLKKRQVLFGRLLGMRMMFVPTPFFVGFSLWPNWWQLSIPDKCRSVLGTIRRIITKGWLIPMKVGRDILRARTGC